MQINKNRKGLALGAVFALVASLFVGTAPAQANENAVVAYPAVGTAAQTTILGTETFDLAFRFGTNVSDSLRNFTTSAQASAFGLIITKPAGVTVSAQASYSGVGRVATVSNTAEIADTEFVVGFSASLSPTIGIGLPSRTSVSAAVSLTVTPFLDLNKNKLADAGEPLGADVVLTFAPWSAMGVAVSLDQPVANSNGATGSFSVTKGSINWAMLDSDFTVVVNHTAAADSTSSTLDAALLVATSNADTSGAGDFELNAGNSSASFEVATVAFTTSSVVQSVSATVKYGATQVAESTLAVSAAAANGVSISPVLGANAALTTANVASVRFNSAFVVRAFAYSASATTSLAVANAITVSAQSGLELDADSGVILNGVTYTTSAALMAAGFTLASGTDTFAVSTFGQVDTTGDFLTVTITNGVFSQALKMELDPTDLSVVYAPTAVAGLAGSSRTFALTVEDQWGETPARTDLRISATVELGGSTSDAVTAAVVAGAATVTVTPTPATRTGSATVTFALQKFSQDDQAWVAGGNSDAVTWNVFSYAAGTDAITSRTASISASISYGVDLSWSATAISVGVANSFSDVVVSAPGLMIRNADQTVFTASDTLTVAANGKTARFEFTSRLAGTYTVTFTNGTATTTSEVVVNPARDADGATITFDTTAIAAGSTKVITGTLTDANGNPVNTSGSATILVTYTVAGSAGIPIGTMPTETDADGEFTITVLTGANDSGTAVVSAAYYKDGASTAVADVLAFNQSIVVGGAVAAPAADQKLTVGTFKGYVAIFTLNYTGQKLSAKIAGKWLVSEDLPRYKMVTRNTGAGYTAKVDLYIDGVFVRSETIVTK